MPDFEDFTRRMAPLKSAPCITIHRRGTLSLNRSAHVLLGGPEAVRLLFARDARVIGLRPTDPRDPDATQLRPASATGNGPWVVSAMAFVRFYDIDTSVTRRWPAQLTDGVLCVDLTGVGEPLPASSGPAPA